MMKMDFSLLKKSQSALFAVAAIMISLGQWADTKDIVISAYESFITHFTDQVELNKLSEVRVGANLSYLEKVFGEARLIKTKDSTSDLQYRYYYGEKFLLTLAVIHQRVSGYQIVSLKPGFMPQITFSDKFLGTNTLDEYQQFSGNFTTDTANLKYYLESLTLGRDGLFLERHLGFTEYGAKGLYKQESLDELNKLLLQTYDDDELLRLTTKLRHEITPNVYSIGEISLEQATEMLLTRYEFIAYFQQAG